MDIMTEGQKIKYVAQPKTNAGNNATLDGAPVWSSSDETIVTMVVDSNDPTGLTAFAVAVGPAGNAQVQCKGDADLGSGVREITGLADVQVTPGEATSILVAAGAPEPA